MSAPIQTRRTSRVPRRKRFDDNWVVDHVLPTGDPSRSPSAMSTSSSVPEGIPSQTSLAQPIQSEEYQHLHQQPRLQQQFHQSAVQLPSANEIGLNPNVKSDACAFVMPHRASTASLGSVESIQSKSTGKQPSGRSKLSITLSSGSSCVTRAQARRKGNQSDLKAISSMSRWKPEDDYLLLRSVLHLRDLSAVHKAVKFTCVFSPADITERWRALLYNSCVSHVARLGVSHLPTWRKNQLDRKVPFSEAEESELYMITAKEVLPNQNAQGLGRPCLRPFERILTAEKGKFFPGRTPISLFHHWCLLRRHDLVIKEEPTEEAMAQEFEYVEDLIQHEGGSPASQAELQALQWLNRRRIRSIRRHEEEAKRWSSLAQMTIYKSVDNIDSDSLNFDNRTLAVLVGTISQLAIKKTVVYLGRKGKAMPETEFEFLDLSEEGSARRISLFHCKIEYSEQSNDFRITAIGKHPVFVNGQPVLPGFYTTLPDQATLVADHLAFVFFVNPALFDVLDANRTEGE